MPGSTHHKGMRPSKKDPHVTWLPPGQSFMHGDYELQGPLYVVDGDTETQSAAYLDLRHAIDVPPKRRVYPPSAPKRWHRLSYEGMSPSERVYYLKNLAPDSERWFDLSSVQLRLYVLERRFFLESDDETERAALLQEAKRLLERYQPSPTELEAAKDDTNAGTPLHSLLRFIGVAQSYAYEALPERPWERHQGLELTDVFLCQMGRSVLREGALTWPWAFTWWLFNHGRYLPMWVYRQFELYREAFAEIFESEFPDGLRIFGRFRPFELTYKAASGEFAVNMRFCEQGLDVPDLSEIPGLRKALSDICVEAQKWLQADARPFMPKKTVLSTPRTERNYASLLTTLRDAGIAFGKAGQPEQMESATAKGPLPSTRAPTERTVAPPARAQVVAKAQVVPPERPKPAKPKPLSMERIQDIREETTRVSKLLGEIFVEEKAAAQVPEAAPFTSRLGLSAPLEALIEGLLAYPKLSSERFAALCQAQGLRPLGLLEEINEWAFETYGEALLEDQGTVLELIGETAQAVKTTLTAKG